MLKSSDDSSKSADDKREKVYLIHKINACMAICTHLIAIDNGAKSRACEKHGSYDKKCEELDVNQLGFYAT